LLGQPRPHRVPTKSLHPLLDTGTAGCSPPPRGSHPNPTAPGPDSDVLTAPGSGRTGWDATGPGEALTPARPFSLSPVPRLLLLVCFVSDN